MAKRLTDKQKKMIIASYAELGSYNAVAKKHKVAFDTVKRVILSSPDIVEIVNEKKAQNTLEMVDFLKSRKNQAQNFIDMCFDALQSPEKIKTAQLQQITTAMGTVIDKFTDLGSTETASFARAREILGGTPIATKPKTK